MDRFEQALVLCLDNLLTDKNCTVAHRTVLHKFAEAIGIYIRRLAEESCEAAEHACRSKPTIFDVERAFQKMNVNPDALLETFQAKRPLSMVLCEEPSQSEAALISCSYHLLGAAAESNQSLDLHIPAHLPPYPPGHTYRPIINPEPSRKRTTSRERRELREKRAMYNEKSKILLNNLLKHTNPTMSLISTAQKDENYLVVLPQPAKGLPLYAALLADKHLLPKFVSRNRILNAEAALPFRYRELDVMAIEDDDEAQVPDPGAQISD